eukprot:m.464410 g.464410  ORF g.464410 m.464410 type:complete len:53 (+) comp21618_c0_seq5:1634-1792(+)
MCDAGNRSTSEHLNLTELSRLEGFSREWSTRNFNCHTAHTHMCVDTHTPIKF